MPTELDWPAPSPPDAVLAQVRGRALQIRRRRVALRTAPAAALAAVLALALGAGGGRAPQSLRTADQSKTDVRTADSVPPAPGSPGGGGGGGGPASDGAGPGPSSAGTGGGPSGGRSSTAVPTTIPRLDVSPSAPSPHLLEDPRGDMLVQDDGVDIVHGDIANDADSLDFIVGVADIGALSDGARFEYDLTYAGHIITVSYYPSGRPAGWTEVRFGTGFGVFECSSCATAVDAGRGRAIGIVPIEAWDALVADLDDRARRPRSPAFGPGAQFSSITLNTGRVSMEPSGVDPASNGVTNARPSDPYPNLDSAAAPPGAVWTAS